MGNSSSTPSSSSTTTTTNGEQYDVFISFRGEDTRNGFTSHLYQALHEKQIKTFIDNQLKRGEEILEGLWSAIGESKIYVIIFSENYASSKWCLRELAEIIKYREMKKQIVIPVFYKVDPSHVGKQIGSYEAAFAKHENELQQEDVVKKWRDALTKASKISGFHSSNARLESEFVRDIVREIWNKLNNISPSCDFKGLVGIEKHIERVVSLLCLEAPDSRIIGIWGMGGMGKTTIADAVFQLVSHQFEKRTHFAPCVRAESEKDSNGLIRLRDEILSKVLNIENQKSGSPSIPQWIKRLLKQKKVLIVLDDVDKFTEWELLVGGLDDDDGLAPGSRIILTTRDKQVLRNCGVEDHNMYKVKGLNNDEGLQLFCKHAFKQNHPTEDLEVLSREVVKIATNVPLAVKVLGSLLYKKSKRDWENAVEKFQRNVHHRVLDVLKISYDGLDKEEKDLFLDIACLSLFEWMYHGRQILLSDREFSLSTLIDKSLVTMKNGRLRMHDLLREMGLEIASKNHSRLWRQEDIIRTLKHNDGIATAVQGIYVDYHREDTHLISQAIEKMYNLRTLIIHCRYSIGDLYYLPDGLRYLHWREYPMEALPLSFNPMNLVELDLSYSKIKQLWEGKTLVQKLKLLNLSCCENLIRIPDLSDIPSIESIDLKFCGSLIEIHSSRGCPKLKQLGLSYCEKVIRIPDLSKIPSAERIDLQSCSSLIEIHSSRGCPKLKLLNLYCCENLIRIPDLSDIPSAESIHLKSCSSLIEIHSSRGCPKLKLLDLSWCRNLIRIPDLSDIPLIESINLKYCFSLIEIHSSRGCPKLKQLDLFYCMKLIRIPDLSNIPSAESIDLQSCSSLREIHSSREFPKNLHSLNLSKCKDLSRLPSNIHIEGSEFNLVKCINLTKFPHILGSIKRLALCYSGVEEVPSTIQSLSKLESLDMKGCESLKRISKSICKLKSLDRLNLCGCCKLESFPDIMEEMELKYLNLRGTAIKELPPSIGNLNRLEQLDLSETAIKELPPSIGNLNRLEELDFTGCKNLERLPKSIKIFSKLYSLKLCSSGVEEVPSTIQSLSKLESLDMKECESLKRISKSICKLKSLDRLNLLGCCKLESFPDIMEEMELKYLNLRGTAIKELPPSIGNLNRLEQLDLSETAIKELPPSIGNLNRLEELDFTVCKNLERLPKSIKIFSKLYSLELIDCGMLRSLPELPSSLRHLVATNCKQLIQSLPDESEFEPAINCKQLIQSLPDSSLYFNFINCLKMNQEAVSNLLIFFRDCIIRKMQRMGTEKIISLFERDERKEVKGSICLPGSGIPEWFSYKNNGSSINIPGLRNDCGRSSYIMGFAVCLVFGFDFDIDFFKSVDVRYDFHIETRDGHKEGIFHKIHFFNMEMEKDEFSYSDHIFLGYNLSSECYELFQKLDTPLANCSMSDYVGTSFEFNVECNRIFAAKGCKVKYRGIQPIYVQTQVMNSVAINQNTEDTSGCNDTAEETCEPHPKRICTEANQCS